MVGQEISDVKISTVLKIVTLISGIALAALAIYKFTALGIFDARDFCLTCYYIIFGILIALSEMPCKCLMSCTSFLGFYIGKAIFCIFLGTIVFNKGNAFFLILAVAFWCEGILYFVLACSCKSKLVNKDDEETDEVKEKPKEEEQNGFKSVDLQGSGADNSSAV
ncbi:unnamed protein product [Blepharisma stoltei]|uniref:Uncharacterized protein n=1 Tax=Blepharisma stoltei TaxID=1481888 RepID=A0AAU9ICU4_9CILI|nr:unnamed protein product [Blepharisma stoltei]